MNKILLFILLACAFFMSSCEEETKKTPEQISHEQQWHGFDVIVVDSCEYLIKQKHHGSGKSATAVGYMAHKGNCKYCAERQERMIRENH